MKQHFTNSVSAIALSAMMLGGVAMTGVFISAEPVFAKSDNARNGNGGNNGNNGNRGNSEDRSGNNNGNNGHGSSSSNLGALNAGHANQQAFLHASANSRVGLIRTYMETVAELEEAQLNYEEMLVVLADLEGFDSGFDTYEDFLAAYEADPTDLEDESTYWEAMAAVAAAEDGGLEGLEDAAGSARPHLRLDADGALEDAANKPITEQVVEDLWVLLEDIDLSAGVEEEAAE